MDVPTVLLEVVVILPVTLDTLTLRQLNSRSSPRKFLSPKPEVPEAYIPKTRNLCLVKVGLRM